MEVDDLKQRLEYNENTGLLIWKPIVEFDHLSRTWNKRFAGKEAGTLLKDGYRYISINGKRYASHRLAWILYYGVWPDGHIDHINQIRLDNRIKNLRDVNMTTNSKNRTHQVNNKSGATGVYLKKAINKWCAYIKINTKQKHLGYYNTKEEAILNRKEAEKLYGFHENHGRIV